MSRQLPFVLALASLASCGGDSATADDDYQAALAAADAKRTEAISLAPASPCNAAPQCDNLTFVLPEGHCSALEYRAYSLVSSTAVAASAAAADERDLARHAVAIAPPPPTSCPAAITRPPNVACVANTCQAVAPAP